MVAIARLERGTSPSELAPPNGTVLNESDLPSQFGLDLLEPPSGRHGHLFIFLSEKGQLSEPDRVNFTTVTPRPSETAFVLARRDDATWRYLGIARGTDEPGLWAIPDVDHSTWRAYGSGGNVSRRLPQGAKPRAQLIVNASSLYRSPVEGDRHDVGIEHHERQATVPFQRVLQVEPDDGLLLPVPQSKSRRSQPLCQFSLPWRSGQS